MSDYLTYNVFPDDSWVRDVEKKSKGEIISLFREVLIERNKLYARVIELEKINHSKEMSCQNEMKQ